MIIAYYRVIVWHDEPHQASHFNKKDGVYRLSICDTKPFGPKLQWLSYIHTLASMIDISIASYIASYCLQFLMILIVASHVSYYITVMMNVLSLTGIN